MKIIIDRGSTPDVLLREIILSAKVVALEKLVLKLDVEDFVEFLKIVNHAFFEVSKQSGGQVAIAMRLPLGCMVNNSRFFVKPENGGLRYGRK